MLNAMDNSGLLISIIMSSISLCCIQLSASKYSNKLGCGRVGETLFNLPTVCGQCYMPQRIALRGMLR